MANPDGSFTFTGHAMPTTTRRNGTWVPIDASLRPQPDGTLAPAAVDGSVRISGGGRAPVTTFDDRAGHTFSVGVSMPLPAPTVTGSTARYESVLPGVDLAVTATATGGARQVFVVHDAAAAANPALRRLVLPVTAEGLTLKGGSDGVISAVDPASGRAAFAAPPPVMWDSTLPAGVASAKPDELAPDSGDRLASSIDGPGVAAIRTAVPTTVDGSAIVLSPPAKALTGAGVTYPLFIDPPFNRSASPYAYVESQHPNVTDYMPTDDLRVGYDNWTTGCGGPCYINGVTRSYITYPGVSGLNGKYIASAVLQLNQLRSSCTGTSAWINASINNNNADIGPGLTWNNQPGHSSVTGSTWMPGGAVGGQQIDIAAIAKWAFTHSYQTLNMVMWASNESDHCIYRHFALNPAIVINYISQPNAPTSLQEVNGTAHLNCNTTDPGPWLSAASGNQISLQDSVSSPDASDAMTAHFYVSTNGGPATDTTTPVTETSSNAPITATVPLTVTDGASYAWNANTTNAAFTSPPSPTCYFRYDASPPTAPVATSTAYPTSGPTTVTSGGSGVITWTSTDAGSGVAGYNYNLNGTSISSGGEGKKQTTANNLSVALSSLRWGTNTLWLQAYDGAGNVSGAVAYSFLVQQSAFGTYAPGTPGDLDGDNKPDLVTVDTAGAIHLYSAPDTFTPNPTGNMANDPNQYGGKVLIAPTSNARWPMPDSASAAGALVAHGGSFTGHNYNDLLVEQNGHLAVATNPGAGGTWTFATTDVTKPACATCANYNGQDWSSVIQMIALPVGTAARPDLLTVEVVNGTGTLWRYAPMASGYAYQPPVAVSTDTSAWHWDDVQLISAGPLPGTTGSTLWVQLMSTFQLYQFHNIEAGIADPNSVKIAVGPPLNLYGLVTTTGLADSNGALPLWTTDFNGALTFLPTYTNSISGVTTMFPGVAVSTNGWQSHHVALGSTYFGHNNSGVGFDGIGNDAFDANLSNGTYAYSATAMANATMNPAAIVNDGAGGCPTAWTSCAAAVGGANTIFMPRADGTYNTFTMPSPWAHRQDNYIALGQRLPIPTPGTSGPAHTIRFLGSATTFNTAGESVPITITFTNGHTQTMTLTFGDWCKAPITGNTVVATMDHRNSTTGVSQTIPNYLFMNSETTLLDNGSPLGPNVQVATISLGVNPLLHIFSIAIN